MSDMISAYVDGVYFPSISREALNELTFSSSISSGAQSNDRRRQYEEHAEDTIQPYDAAGKPRSEFYRLYPEAAQKVFNKQEIASVKKQL